MKVFLINPPIEYLLFRGMINPVIKRLFYNSAPLGILYIASLLESKGVEVRVLDAPAMELTHEEAFRYIEEFKPDVVGITCTTVSSKDAKIFADIVKRRMPEVRTILGGPYISSQPETAMSHPSFDIGVIGEGELTMLELMETIDGNGRLTGAKLKKIRGIIFRENGGLIKTEPREQIKNLDSLPFPARHLLPLKYYKPVPIDEYGWPKFSIISSRGCPLKCIYCDKSVFRSTYRSFSPSYIVSEMEHLIKDFGAQDIAFVDSNFTYSRKRVNAIVDEIMRRGIKVKWTCSTRVDVVDKDLFLKMREAGCVRARFGIESGNDDVLKFIKKTITKEEIRRAVKSADEAGLQPKAFFMIGHLPDNLQTIEETIRFARSLPLKDITVQINTPLINTTQYSLAPLYGRFASLADEDRSFWQPVFVPKGMKEEELIDLHKRFYRVFYSNPKVWWRHIKSIKSVRDIKRYIGGMKLFIFLSMAKLI